jgi:threonine aldolase
MKIDLRSDTVTRPTPGMLDAMMSAPVGDDVYGDDPTVNLLEARVAKKLGHEAALFLPSGTQSNLVALMSHCQRGDEYIVGQHAHTYRYEAGGAAVLGSIQPQPIDLEPDGTLDLAKVAGFIKPDDSHFAKTQLLCVENTHGGLALPLAYHAKAQTFCREKGLGLHLDGARIFNAAVHHGVDIDQITRHYDSVSVCFSKGLGAPVGSVLVGSSDLIGQARRWRKMLGGGMRQAGMLAAGCLYALDHHVDRLAEDHLNARLLAKALGGIDGLEAKYAENQTNMVFVSMEPLQSEGLNEFMASRDIIMRGGATTRLVTHLDIKKEHVQVVADAFREFLGR